MSVLDLLLTIVTHKHMMARLSPPRQQQTVIARSVLELPPIIAHRGRPLAFVYPCLSVVLPTPKIPGDRIFLDLRCSFEVSSATICGRTERQHHEIGNAFAGSPREPIPRVVPNRLHGGVLCVEVWYM